MTVVGVDESAPDLETVTAQNAMAGLSAPLPMVAVFSRRSPINRPAYVGHGRDCALLFGDCLYAVLAGHADHV
jgi:hypothetical protein